MIQLKCEDGDRGEFFHPHGFWDRLIKSMAKLEFHIQSTDHFGQGVHKDGKRIVFIPKTLPGETGEAEVIEKKKGVEFAVLTHLENPSPQRIEAECPHFAECQACAYLHTPYEQEMIFKRESLENQLKTLAKDGQSLPPVKAFSSPTRFGQRNRLQLHFDKNHKRLGLLRKNKNNQYDILPIPQCLLPTSRLKESLQALYREAWWERPEFEKSGDSGVVILKELKSGDIQLTVDSNYAGGSFEQVHREMNDKALQLIEEFIQREVQQDAKTLDLFGGRGNLSVSEKLGESWVIDIYGQYDKFGQPPRPHQHYLSCNLFKTSSWKLRQQLPPTFSPDLIIVDPPRSGFKQMAEYAEDWKPQHIVAMSCQSSTLMRDLKPLKNYTMQNIYLLDFFPGTFHYESLIFFSRKSENPQISDT